jgi:hypothetical protein
LKKRYRPLITSEHDLICGGLKLIFKWNVAAERGAFATQLFCFFAEIVGGPSDFFLKALKYISKRHF